MLPTNARSVLTKIEHFHALLANTKPDIVFVTETWLSENILDSELVGGLPYILYHCDRETRRGGRVCCVVKGNLSIVPRAFEAPRKADVLCLDHFS